MLRSTWWLALSAIAGICTTGSARAQDCDSDDACPTSSYCAFEWADGGSGVSEDVACTPEGDCGGEAAPPAPTSGTCTPLPVGTCEVQADCAEGLTCVKPTYVDGCAGGAEDAPAPAPTDPGGGADIAEPAPPVDCGVSEPVEARYGNCELPAMPCTSDAECMAGLTCLPAGATSPGSSGGTDSGGSDDGVSADADQAPERPADPVIGEPASQCGYQPASCDGGEACKAGYECVQIEVGGTCTGGAPAECPPDELGCTPPEPEEPECTTDYAKVCLPVQDPCDSDADCADDQKCVEFTNADGGLESPESWGATGSVKSCLPEGIAAVAQAGSGGVGGGVSTGADNGGTKGEGEVAPEEGGNLGDDVKSSASNCSVGFGGGSAPSLAGFVLAGLAIVRRRRRR